MEFYGSKKAGSVVAVVLVWVGTRLGPATHSRHHLAECRISPVSAIPASTQAHYHVTIHSTHHSWGYWGWA